MKPRAETMGLPKPGESQADEAKSEVVQVPVSEFQKLKEEIAKLKGEKVKKKALPPPFKDRIPIKVKALRNGFYGNVRRKAGDIFEIEDKFFLGNWMKPI